MENKKLTKKSKIIICLSSVLAVIVAAVIILSTVFSTWTEATILYAVMPHEIETQLDAGTLKMGVILSERYKKNELEEKEPLSAFNYYYYDLDGKRKEVEYFETFMFGEEKVQPMLVFPFKAAEKISRIKAVIGKALPFVIIILVAVILVLWFRNWSRREDEAKEKAHKNSSNKKK